MSWNRMIFIFLLVASAAHAQEAKCPAYHGKVPLGYVGVNDGPPDHFSTELLPDFSSGEGNQEHGYYDVGFIFDNGHNLYLDVFMEHWTAKTGRSLKWKRKLIVALIMHIHKANP